ncbi:MAG: hypothetical protein JWO38_3373 [Gemmataceae bacterium]|nr:hypothetical protein [Gemmataceae bacterium]
MSISHATGATDAAISTDPFGTCDGSVQVFRLGILDDVPPEAAGVALTWAPNSGSNLRYSISKAVGCAFRSSSFGSGAKKRAAFYRAHRNTRGGPPGEDGGTFKSMFCSMFVIACYQAVMDDARTDGVLSLDAKNTSPMYLDGYLRNSPHWSTINAMKD